MTNKEFIEKIAEAVIEIAPLYGICVYSPIIAQACLESGYGTTNKAAKYNNFFGLKFRDGRLNCHNGTFRDTSKEQNEDGTYYDITDSWYSFETLQKGVEGYFQFININRYKNLKGITDPYLYLKTLREDGYATDNEYVEKVYNTLKNNNLERFDKKGDDTMSNLKFKVHLDPGHYSDHYNKNTVGLDYYESKAMWVLGGYLKTELENLGVEVTMSRNNINDNPSLYNRGYGAKGKDLFLSLHSNAASSETPDYPIVYRGVDRPEADEFGLKLANLIADLMGTKQKGRTGTRLSASDRDGNGKLDDEYYGVLDGADRAGLKYFYIVEHSFHTNFKSTKFLCDDNNLRLLAKKEAELIASYFNVQKTEEPKQETPKVEVQETKYYRVRKSWEDAKSQIGAYTNLDNAKKNCKDGYKVFDWNGNVVYPEQKEEVKPTVTNTYKVRVTASALNVRKGPSTSYSIIKTVKKNEVYNVLEEKNGWGRITDSGWISLSYTEKVVVKTSEYTTGMYKVNVIPLNIRKGPGTNYQVVGTINKNDTFTIVEVQNEYWGRLKSGAGWISIHKNYCTKVK